MGEVDCDKKAMIIPVYTILYSKQCMNTYEKNTWKFWKEISNSELFFWTTHYIGMKKTQSNTLKKKMLLYSVSL